MIQARGLDAVRVTKVMGHATDEVERGQARAEDQFGNDQADVAAKLLGRRHHSEFVINAKQGLF